MKNKPLARMLHLRQMNFDLLSKQAFCSRAPMSLVLLGHRSGKVTWDKLGRVLSAEEMKVAQDFALTAAVQRVLKSHGLLDRITGERDTKTVDAVKAFQVMAGLPPTGEVDKETLAEMAPLYPKQKELPKREPAAALA